MASETKALAAAQTGERKKSKDKSDRKDKSEHKDKSERKEKKDKKEKKVSADGIEKKSKDKKKDKKRADKLAAAADLALGGSSSLVSERVVLPRRLDSLGDMENTIVTADVLVPFALPLADKDLHHHVYKLVKQGSKMKMVHRGVKECYKMIKKTPTGSFNVSGKNTPQGVVILAADVAPMEVIMRFPLLCEEHSIPYLFVKSRTELGIAAATKRSTSIVILKTEAKQSATTPEDAEKKEYLEGLRSLIALAHTEYATQVQPWLNGIHQDQIAYEEMKAAAARE